MFCIYCSTPLSINTGRCPRCYPEWHVYGNTHHQLQMLGGSYPQQIQQSQFMAPMPTVQYQTMPQPQVMNFVYPLGQVNQHGFNVQGSIQQPCTPNFERQDNPVNTIAGPQASTFEVARLPDRAVAFEINNQAEDILTNPEESLMPRALQENWLSISQRQHRIQFNLLEQNQTILEEYVDKMDDSGYRDRDHRQLVRNTIKMTRPWFKALDDLRSEDPSRQKDRGTTASRIRYVNQKHSFVVKSIPGQPLFETGIIDCDWKLRDIRRKRFINSGVQCSKCADGEADHPERTHNEMYEIFSYFVDPNLTNRKEWCQTCMKQRFTKKARLHRTGQHNLGMWYDHPENDFDKLGQYEGWKHEFPSRKLRWTPKPVAKMYDDMRRARIPANADA